MSVTIRLLCALFATMLIVICAPPAGADPDEFSSNLFEDAVTISTLDQPPNVRNDFSFCVDQWVPGGSYYDPLTSQIVTYDGYWIDCVWTIECMLYRVDDIHVDTVFAEFTAYGIPFFDLEDALEDHVLIIKFCREGGQMLHITTAPTQLLAYADRTYTLPPVATEVTDPAATLVDLWAAIPEPTIEIEGAPPVADNTWVQASTWYWIDEIETPLIAVSISAADTVRLAVRAKVAEIAWDFGDGTTLVCPADKLVVWEDTLHPYNDSDQGCTHIYKKVSEAGFTVVADVLFEGESVLQSKAAASLPWPAPVWVPYAETRQVPGDLVVQVFEIASRN